MPGPASSAHTSACIPSPCQMRDLCLLGTEQLTVSTALHSLRDLYSEPPTALGQHRAWETFTVNPQQLWALHSLRDLYSESLTALGSAQPDRPLQWTSNGSGLCTAWETLTVSPWQFWSLHSLRDPHSQTSNNYKLCTEPSSWETLTVNPLTTLGFAQNPAPETPSQPNL